MCVYASVCGAVTRLGHDTKENGGEPVQLNKSD